MQRSQRLMGLGSLLCLTLTTSCAHTPKAPELKPLRPQPVQELPKIPDECFTGKDPAERPQPAPSNLPFKTPAEKIAKWQFTASALAVDGASVRSDNEKLRGFRDSCFDGLIAAGLKGEEVIVLEVEPK